MNSYDVSYDSVASASLGRYAFYNSENAEAKNRKRRDPKKSEIAKDPGYQDFLDKAFEITQRYSDERELLYVQWETGGYEGGSCWNDHAPTAYSTGAEPPELIELDSLLEKLCPSITFLQYKNLCNAVVESTSYTSGDYYGNSSNYNVKYILLSKLYSYLKEKGLI